MHAGLAAGAALAALPVILHLFMRQTPKHVIFPALRLIRERQNKSKKRMRIKNWLLLLARMAILALMAFALARPRLYSEAPLGDSSVPTALGLVFDTSLSMEYKDKDKTRLDEAKDRAREIVAKLPESSLVFVVDSALPGIPVGLPPLSALKIIDDLATHPVNRPLNAAMGQVYAAVAECDRPVRVVYVLTDLARSAWTADHPADGLDLVAKLKASKAGKIVTFVLRLIPEDMHNVAIDSAEPPATEFAQGESIEIHTRLKAMGQAPTTRMAEFWLDGVKSGEKPIELAPNDQKEVTFAAPPRLKEGVFHRGEIRLSGSPDPLAADDRRFFTFRVRPPQKVLILSDRDFDSSFVLDALEPESPDSPSSFVIDSGRASDLSARYKGRLGTYSCIFLLNVRHLEEAEWGALNVYVHEGGGLVVALGHRSDPASYNNSIASQLLPAHIGDRPTESRAELTFGKIADITHPLFQKYGKDFDGLLSQVPVYAFWPVTPAADQTRVLVSFADGSPALLERSFKGARTGHVLLWTTPLARRAVTLVAGRRDPDVWNEFPVASAWAFPVLMNLTVPYLAGITGAPLNFEAGENVSLPLDPSTHYSNFTVTGPDAKTTERLSPSPSQEYLQIDAPRAVGQWTVKATSVDKSITTLGFSLNPPRAESQFTPLEKADLDRLFGKDGYLLAENAQTYVQQEARARFGYEIFPWLMFLIMLIVCLENLLANTFYKQAARAGSAAVP